MRLKRIVAISDLHGDKETLGHSRRGDVREALFLAVEHALRVDADWFVCLGDVADPDSGSGTFHAQEDVLEAALTLSVQGIASIWLTGNHDVAEDGGGASVLSPMRALERMDLAGSVYVADTPRFIQIGEDLIVVCFPFTPASAPYDAKQFAKETMLRIRNAEWGSDARIITLSHLHVAGVTLGDESVEMARGREVFYPLEETKGAVLRLQGHYHQRQLYDAGDGGPPIHVVGSPARFTFGDEDHSPAFLDITI